MKRLLTTLNIKIARCSVLRLSRGFQWSFESASLAEAVGGRSKMIRESKNDRKPEFSNHAEYIPPPIS